jgi:hypothetical protein
MSKESLYLSNFAFSVERKQEATIVDCTSISCLLDRTSIYWF